MNLSSSSYSDLGLISKISVSLLQSGSANPTHFVASLGLRCSCAGLRGAAETAGPGIGPERGAAHLRTQWGSWLPHLSGCGDRARARACVCSRKVGPHRLRAATAVRSVRVVGGAVTHFLWVSRTTARFRCRLEPGVRAPAPRAGPAPPAPRPPPARRAPSPARGARGARSGARRSAESGWRPPPPAPLSVASRWPSPFHLPSLPDPAAALPPSLPSVPPRPARSAPLPQAPLAARVPMDRRTDTCRWLS
ncbi:atherin-like [Cervus canadensis]|uniref:atherin-like n=1 Tax=Cervus canadensis TaxID=1574408 RepID=UPI001CA3712E|nr:atherin-like [Cervus canadensis]